jgi:protein-disulfide isomerase
VQDEEATMIRAAVTLSALLLAAPAAAVDAALQADANARAERLAFDLQNDPGTPTMGNPDGDTVVVEFFDYQCPFCKAAEPRLKDLVKEDGNIKLVIKDFPILGPVSVVAAKAALASERQGKHTVFQNALMERKGQLTEDRIFRVAESVGLDVDQLKKDMAAPEIADQLIENFNLARKLKISVVPGYIVGGNVLSGLSSETSTAAIDFGEEVAAERARAAAKSGG